MACSPTPAAQAVLQQATELWPGRSTATDGICPSAAHTAANPNSDHEWGGAVDLTKDLSVGLDTKAVAEAIRRRIVAGDEDRIEYLISDGEIVSSRENWTWRPYTGRNDHSSHLHISFTRAGAQDTTRPFLDGATTGIGGHRLDPDTLDVDVLGVDLDGIAKFTKLMTDGRTWVRVLGVIVGLVLIVIAVAMLTGDQLGVGRLIGRGAQGAVKARTGVDLDVRPDPPAPAPIARQTNAGRP